MINKYTSVSICNDALRILGEESISDINAIHPTSQECKGAYDRALIQCLNDDYWKFATGRAKIENYIDNVIEYGYKYAYPIPNDCVRIREVADGHMRKVEHDVEGNNIVTDSEAPIYLKYTRYITDPNLFSPEFKNLMVYEIARDLCTAVVDKDNLLARIMAEKERILTRAKYKNAAKRSSFYLNGRSSNMYNVR